MPDVRDQAYKGLAAEAVRALQAVQQTRGLVLKDSGRVKPGFYRAWVGDAFQNLNLRKSTIPNSAVEQITGISNIVGVTVKRWDSDGNAIDMTIIETGRSRDVNGRALAKMLGLASAGILDAHPEGANWVFTHRGSGNGARGLSQHGADMLASKGWRFDQILQQYYQEQQREAAARLHLRRSWSDTGGNTGGNISTNISTTGVRLAAPATSVGGHPASRKLVRQTSRHPRRMRRERT